MTVQSAYKFSLPGFWSDRTEAELVCDLNGRRYLLRMLDDFVLFRLADDNRVEHTFFMPFRGPTVRSTDTFTKSDVWTRSGSSIALLRGGLGPPVYMEEVFAEQIARGEYGRVALYSCPEARDCSPLLFFWPDGAGFFLDYDTANGYSEHEPEELVEFAWEGTAQGIADSVDILTVQWPHLELLCRNVFTTQVWPRMKDPFVRNADLVDAPLAWKCGSQEELIRITHCIFHTQPGEWSEIEEQSGMEWRIVNHCIPLFYAAEMEPHPGGPGVQWTGRIGALCKLAFRYNTFTGHKWEYNRYEGKTRRECYRVKPIQLTCRLAPPSAHERAESLLTLSEWLEGKVSEEERRAYLGLE